MGCGSTGIYLSSASVERTIAQSLMIERHIYTKVLCPSQVPQQKSHSFQCTARLDVGHYSISVTEIDDRGHVRWVSRVPVGILQMNLVTAAISRSMFARRGVHSTVICPSQVLERQGLSFKCTAVVRTGTSTLRPGSYPVDVSQLDGAGDVTYVGH